MKMNAISAASNLRSNGHVSFNGQWKKKAVYNAADFHIYNQNIYIPDKNETPEEISSAWKKETGMYPIDWVKKTNPYNQLKKMPAYGEELPTEYVIHGQKYMPADVLKASAMQKLKHSSNDSDKLNSLKDLANLSNMEYDDTNAKSYERQMVEIYAKQTSPSLKKAVASSMNEYKENWGKAVWARDVYNTGKSIFEDSDEIVKEYNA